MDTLSLLRSICFFIIVVVSVSGCKNSQSEKTTAPPVPIFHMTDKPAILATIRDDEKPSSSDLRITFARQGGGVAYTIGKDPKISVVHNNRPGSLYEGIGYVAISPDGSRIAYSALADGKWRMVVDGVEGEPYTLVENPMFSPDGRHVAYQVMNDDVWHMVVDAIVSIGSKIRYREHEFSGDSEHLVYIDADDKGNRRLVVTDIAFKRKHIIYTGVTSLILNADRTAVAAVSRNSAGSEQVIQFTFAKPAVVTRGADYDRVPGYVFAPAGTDLAYFGERQGRMYGVFNGQEELLPAGVTPGTAVINQAGNSVGVLLSANDTMYFYQLFRNSGRKGKVYDEAEWLVYSSDGAVSAFAARKGKRWCVVVNGKEGPKFERVVTPKFSPDGKYLVYRARKKGKRFVVVADTAGRTIKQHPAYEQVFDVQFTADGKSVAYGVKDGNKLIWKVERMGE